MGPKSLRRTPLLIFQGVRGVRGVRRSRGGRGNGGIWGRGRGNLRFPLGILIFFENPEFNSLSDFSFCESRGVPKLGNLGNLPLKPPKAPEKINNESACYKGNVPKIFKTQAFLGKGGPP